MVLLALLSLGLGGVAVGLVAWAVALPYTKAAARVAQLDAYGYAPAALDEADARTPGAVERLAGRIGDLLTRVSSRFADEDLRRELVAAGIYRVSPRALLGYRAMAFVLCGFFGATTAPMSGVMHTVIALCMAWAGWTLPLTFVHSRRTRRLGEIDRALPDLIDQIVVTLEGGLGFSSSVQLAASRLTGPLGEELRLTLQEQRMGLALRESMEHMVERADTPNMKSFGRAVVQGDALGVSIGHVMRDLAGEMRKRRRASAEERAQRAPVKMLFPLIFFIFPALFIVLLGPPMTNVLQTLGGG